MIQERNSISATTRFTTDAGTSTQGTLDLMFDAFYDQPSSLAKPAADPGGYQNSTGGENFEIASDGSRTGIAMHVGTIPVKFPDRPRLQPLPHPTDDHTQRRGRLISGRRPRDNGQHREPMSAGSRGGHRKCVGGTLLYDSASMHPFNAVGPSVEPTVAVVRAPAPAGTARRSFV
jgi:hypothetical protein